MKPILVVAALLFASLVFTLERNAVSQEPPDSARGMSEADFLRWVDPGPLDASAAGDECSNQPVHFAFNGSTSTPAFACRQDGPERGWYRQRIRGLHVAVCPDQTVGASCDVSLTRICRSNAIGKEQGLPAPCSMDGDDGKNLTGAKGCAICGKAISTADQH